MTKFVVAYVATLSVFLAVDAVWLTVMSKRLYKPTLDFILLDKFLLAPAGGFYAIYIVGVMIFAVPPAFQSRQWTTALGYGALFGFFSFGVYDLTNWSTLKNWNATITAADLCWGTFITGLSAALGTNVTQALAS